MLVGESSWNVQPIGQESGTQPEWVALYNFGESNCNKVGPGCMSSLPTKGFTTGRTGRGLHFESTDINTHSGIIVPGITDAITCIMVVEFLSTTIANNFLFGEAAPSVGAYNYGFYENSDGFIYAFVHNGTTGVPYASGISGSLLREPSVWVFTYGGGDNNIRGFLNGVERNEPVAQTGSIRRDASATLGVGRWNSANANFRLLAGAVSNRRMNQNEIKNKFSTVETTWNALFGPRNTSIWSSAQNPNSQTFDSSAVDASFAHGPYPLVARPSVLTSVNKQIRSEQSDLVSAPSATALNNGFVQLLAFGDSAIIDTISSKVLPLTVGSAPVRGTSTAGIGARYGNSGGSQYLYLTCPSTLAGTVVWYGETHDLLPCIYRADPSTGVLLYSNAGSIYMRSNSVDATGAGLSGAFPANKPVCIILTGDTTGCRIYCNGKEVGTIAAAWKWTSGGVPLAMHLNGPSSGAGCDATDYIVGISEKAIPASLAADMSSNPWQLFSSKTVQPFPGPRRKLM